MGPPFPSVVREMFACLQTSPFTLFIMFLILPIIFCLLVVLLKILIVLLFSYQTVVFLHDLTSKKIFGRGYECNGLYYFGSPLPPKVSLFSPQVFGLSVFDSSVFSSQTLDLWHERLGHANFQYLCWLFPTSNKICKLRFSI